MKQGTQQKGRAGFTLIEVIVVLAILALFSAIVVFAVGLSRAKGEDARTKETLASVRTSATDEYIELASFNTVCSSGKTHTIITTLAAQQGLSITDYICVADPTQFAVLFPLKAESGYWCVDSTGNAKRMATADDPLSSKSCGPPPPPAEEGGGGGTEEEGGPSNLPPIASAGADQNITLPTNSVVLDGSGSDFDGSITSYLWTKLSGTGGTIQSPLLPDTNITGLSAGTYVFQLAVTDNG
ncbi:MAG TPA: prepilin-type N-terminal cleavage/methylation domain-containing protein, partial [Candidatus Paceibacterota bacterium]|nr:prepilin-type N-terminal cleavage/methylation domain-containing protein [Candidatus Paceibacterota bacterium]